MLPVTHDLELRSTLMSSIPSLVTLGVISLVSASLSAQVAVTATVSSALALGDLLAPATVSVPGGTNVTSGQSLRWSSAFSSSTLDFAIDHRDQIVVTYRCIADVRYPVGGGASGGIAVTCRSAVPVPVDVRVIVLHQSGSWGRAGGRVAAAGLTPSISFDNYAATQPLSPPTRIEQSYKGVIDSNGLSVDMYLNSVSGTGFGFGGYASGQVRIEITAQSATTYGLPCGGASLTYDASLAPLPSVTVADPTAVLGVLMLGSQRTDIPLSQLVPFAWPCSLRTDILVAVPIAIGPPSQRFDLPIVVPPGTWTLQALTSDGSTVNTTNGLEFFR